MIHDRDAHDEVLQVIDEEGAPDRWVMHCFSGDAAVARACLDRGAHLSFAGTVTFKNAEPLRGALRITPQDRILVETDAPFLTPMPYRGRPNASYLVPHTMRAMAEVRGDDLGDALRGCGRHHDRGFRRCGDPKHVEGATRCLTCDNDGLDRAPGAVEEASRLWHVPFGAFSVDDLLAGIGSILPAQPAVRTQSATRTTAPACTPHRLLCMGGRAAGEPEARGVRRLETRAESPRASRQEQVHPHRPGHRRGPGPGRHHRRLRGPQQGSPPLGGRPDPHRRVHGLDRRRRPGEPGHQAR